MAQLFWKYFFAFFLTQLTAVIVFSLALYWQTQANVMQSVLLSVKHLNNDILYDSSMHMSITLCMVVALVLSFIMAWRLTRPINQLFNAIQSAIHADLNTLVASDRFARFRGLDHACHSLGTLMRRVQHLILGQTRMLHHVSHELRTPLARLQMAAGLAMQNQQKVNTALQRIELESIRMDNMIAELLEISRLESGMLKLRKESVDICDVLNTIVQDAEFEQTGKKLSLNLPQNGEVSTPVYLEGQIDLLNRAIENVVRNALKYSPDNSTIVIDLLVSKKTKEMVIEVQDAGFGVSEEELEAIFLPFVRAKSGSDYAGHGVGLSITKHIVEAHGGYVNAVNLNPKGFMVRLHFPL